MAAVMVKMTNDELTPEGLRAKRAVVRMPLWRLAARVGESEARVSLRLHGRLPLSPEQALQIAQELERWDRVVNHL